MGCSSSQVLELEINSVKIKFEFNLKFLALALRGWRRGRPRIPSQPARSTGRRAALHMGAEAQGGVELGLMADPMQSRCRLIVSTRARN
jgi:hypothetical protein